MQGQELAYGADDRSSGTQCRDDRRGRTFAALAETSVDRHRE
ncbi:hypothetical protein SFR_3775 [Streptomyces sp. FR-008]|nr:hypothetical protein SFR_3775 [Streptomyces sp. FR-008]